MKKLITKITAFLFVLILCGCQNTSNKNNQNVGYNVPSLKEFSITLNYYSIEEKEDSINLTSTYLSNQKYHLLRIDEEHVYLGISLEEILNDKNITLHDECVIFGGESYDDAKAIYDSMEDLYIAIYQNNLGPWEVINPLDGNAILVDKSNNDISTYTTKLRVINAILTQY